jgi:arginyl-tRNA synthetase
MKSETLEQKIQKYIKTALLGIAENIDINIQLERPASFSFGDLTSNISLSLAKNLNLKPIDLANKIKENLLRQENKEIDKIEIAGPGFLNFYLNKGFIREDTLSFLESTFTQTKYSHKKVLVEHSSPNLFKPFHIGHLMNNIVGNFVVCAMKEGGADVTTLSFPSDVSLGIAKTIFIINKEGGLSQDIFKKSTKDIIAYLGESYVKATNYFTENENEIKEAKGIANILYNKIPSEVFSIYEKTKEINLNYFQEVTSSLGTKFDDFIFESESGVVGKIIVNKYTPSVFTKSEGAIVYLPKEIEKNISVSVFINSEGNPTYAAKDIGLLDKKSSLFSPDNSFTITSTEQISHFKTVLTAYGHIDKERADKNIHVPHGNLTLNGLKISSRKGGVLLAEDVIETVLEEVRERGGDKIAHFTKEEQQEIQKNIALSALRVTILKNSLGSNINFDPERSLSFEGDSGPYLEYTHARVCSLLEKAEGLKLKPKLDEGAGLLEIESLLYHLQNILKRSVEDIAPQFLIAYLFELAKSFNSFYAENTVIDEENKKTSEHRLYIVSLVGKSLKRGMNTLGIKEVNKM